MRSTGSLLARLDQLEALVQLALVRARGSSGGGGTGGVSIQPVGSSALGGVGLTAVALSMIVANPSLYAIGHKVLIDNEVILITGGAGTSASPFTIARAQNLTTAAIHPVGAAVFGDDCRPITALMNSQAGKPIELVAGDPTKAPWTVETRFHWLDSSWWDATLTTPPCVLYGNPDVEVFMKIGVGTGSIANAVFAKLANYGPLIPFAVTSVYGAEQFTLDPTAVSVGGLAAGDRIIARQGTNGLESSQYTIKAIVPAGLNWLVTVDRPVQFTFVAGELGTGVEKLTDYMHDVYVYGRGMKFTGDGDQFCELSSATLCGFQDCTMDSATCVTAITFDVGSYNCWMERVTCITDAPTGIWVTGEGHSFVDTQSLPASLVGPQKAWLIANALDITFVCCDGQGASFGWSISTDDAPPSPLYPSRDLTFVGCRATGNTTGWLIQRGSNDIDLIGCSALGNVAFGLQIGVSPGDPIPTDIRVIGGSYGKNQTNGAGIYLQPGITSGTFAFVDVDVDDAGNSGFESDAGGTTNVSVVRLHSSQGNVYPFSVAGPCDVDLWDPDITSNAGTVHSIIDCEAGGRVKVHGGVFHVAAAPIVGIVEMVGANSSVSIDGGTRITGAALGATTGTNTTAASQRFRKTQDVDFSGLGVQFAGPGLKNWGTFQLNGTNPVAVPCACAAGDVPAIIRTLNGGGNHVPPAVVVTANLLTATGVVAAASGTYAFLFP